MLLQLLHPVRRFPGEVIPARRGDLRTGGVPQRHQVVVQLGHVLAGDPLVQGPPRRARCRTAAPPATRCRPGTAPAPGRSPGPAAGSQVSVPPPCPVTVQDPRTPASRSPASLPRYPAASPPTLPWAVPPGLRPPAWRPGKTPPPATPTPPRPPAPPPGPPPPSGPGRRRRDPVAAPTAGASACRSAWRPCETVSLTIWLLSRSSPTRSGEVPTRIAAPWPGSAPNSRCSLAESPGES